MCRLCNLFSPSRAQLLVHCSQLHSQHQPTEDIIVALQPLAPGPEESPAGPEEPLAEKPAKRKRGRPKGSTKKSLSDCPEAKREGASGAGNKKSVISVILTQHETLPDATKMVPVEGNLADADSAAGQPQDGEEPAGSQPQESDAAPSVPAACPDDPDSQPPQPSPEPKPDPASKPASSQGFQEYCIKQVSTSLAQSQLKIFTCEFCNKIFKFRHSLVAHLRTHTQEKPFQCPHCSYASAIKANLNVHLRKHTGEKFSCPHCPFVCLSPGHLKVHVERVHLKVKQHCDFCQKKYSDVKNLLRHLEQRHNIKDPAVQQSYQQLRLKTRQGQRQLLYHCPTCNRRFKNQLQRERHLLVHGPLRPFGCLLCDYAATKMAALRAHVRKHLFLYVCSRCGKMCVSSQRLRAHLKDLHPDGEPERAFAECIDQAGEGGATGERGDRPEPGEDGGTLADAGGSGDDPRTTEGPETEVGGDGGRGLSEAEAGAEPGEAAIGDARTSASASQGAAGPNVSAESVSPPEEDGYAKLPCCSAATAGVDEDSSMPDATETAARGSHGGNAEENTTSALVKTDESTAVPSDRSGPPSDPNAQTPATKDTPDVESGCTAQSPDDSGLKDGSESHSEMEPEAGEQSAFQKVVASLSKSQLNMETFLRLRKIYGDLECQYCARALLQPSCLKRHVVQKHSGLLLRCSSPGCKYASPDKYKLQSHLKTHQEQVKSCPVCNQNFPEYRLKNHIRNTHPDTLPQQGTGLMVKRAEKCPYCDSYFLKNSSDLQQHIWAHEGLKPFHCTVCDYASRSKSNLKAHMNRHSSERSNLCDLCGKKFKSKVTLKSHRLSHTDEGE
ncbi:hypothetical protein NHX12_001092 [Muraenolepis orangiensis]|uniref:C2H2-type domain-containing protein n=1 Tax=Muraenolepis orangiensis TaxID=630683 RepID=A0A9Q0E031_9TELE|nr:hypothetical protein NHX12_001092 [Muraenolepis orangiensis]